MGRITVKESQVLSYSDWLDQRLPAQGPERMIAQQELSVDIIECLTNACTAVLKMYACAVMINKIPTKSITEFIMFHYYYAFSQATDTKSIARILILKSLEPLCWLYQRVIILEV